LPENFFNVLKNADFIFDPVVLQNLKNKTYVLKNKQKNFAAQIILPF
jgi:hypothetical protein